MEPEIDYGSCILKAPLSNGSYSGRLTLTNDVEELVIAIWNYSGANPEFYFWDLASDGTTILITE